MSDEQTRMAKALVLIRDMHEAIVRDKPYRAYGIDDEVRDFERRMRELGMEIGK